jgi:16S rRNA (cytosine967-C5)-methyltransferase
MNVSPARRIAYDVLRRVEEQGAFASDALHAQLESSVKREDAALATQLTLGVLRWRRQLDFLIERQARRPAAELDLEPLLALRIGLYQLRFLTRVPASAAVNESVELVKKSRTRSAASFINAVLRGLVRRGARVAVENLLPPDISAADRLGILHSHPTWLVERWLARMDERATVALLEANNRAGRLVGAVHDPALLSEVAESLRAEGLTVGPAKWLASALYVSGGNPLATGAYAQGSFSLQDEASQMVPHLLDVRAGQRVLDLCAAPGGKTASLIRAAGNGRNVVAADRYDHRLRAMRGQLARVGLPDACLTALEATAPLPFAAKFNRILVDAPCSGTGTLDRNPEIRWRLQPADLAALHAKQVALLRNALDRLAAGGRLVYSTCSLEPEENEQVVEEGLEPVEVEGAGIALPDSGPRKRRRYRLVSGAAALAPYLAQGAEVSALFDAEGNFHTLPHIHGTSGFFAVVIENGDQLSASD